MNSNLGMSNRKRDKAIVIIFESQKILVCLTSWGMKITGRLINFTFSHRNEYQPALRTNEDIDCRYIVNLIQSVLLIPEFN